MREPVHAIVDAVKPDRRTRQRNECPSPPGSCSHPTLCRIMGCAALAARATQESAEANRRQAALIRRIVEAAMPDLTPAERQDLECMGFGNGRCQNEPHIR